MKNDMIALLKTGEDVIIFNKNGDFIADGIIDEITKDSYSFNIKINGKKIAISCFSYLSVFNKEKYYYNLKKETLREIARGTDISINYYLNEIDNEKKEKILDLLLKIKEELKDIKGKNNIDYKSFLKFSGCRSFDLKEIKENFNKDISLYRGTYDQHEKNNNEN